MTISHAEPACGRQAQTLSTNQSSDARHLRILLVEFTFADPSQRAHFLYKIPPLGMTVWSVVEIIKKRKNLFRLILIISTKFLVLKRNR